MLLRTRKRSGPMDLVILCVKAFDAANAIQSALPLIGIHTLVLTLQNGLGNAETIAQSVPAVQVLGGTTAMAANLAGPGVVRFAGSGETLIGEFQGGVENAKQVAEKFNRAGLQASATPDLQAAVWSKAVINAGINPLTAILRVRNGMLLKTEEARKILRLAVSEAAVIARANGVKLLYQSPVNKAEAVAKATSSNISSMLQDVISQQRTEIDAINGEICRAARKLQIEAPVNRVLYSLVKSLEKSYDERTA